MITDGGVGHVDNPDPTLVTRACLVCAALLPWFAVFSGTYGLYFYVILAATLLADWLFIPVLILTAPLAALLLLILPASALYAAFRHTPAGWAGWLTRTGCLVSMGFALTYSSLMAVMLVVWFLQEGVDDKWGPFIAWRIAILVFGLWATWRTWQWLRRQSDCS